MTRLATMALAAAVALAMPLRSTAAQSPGSVAYPNGEDYSANAPSPAGFGTLLATIPAASGVRGGGVVQAQCTAGLAVVFDDPAGLSPPTVIILAGPAANGGQGGTLDLGGMPHFGRIRIYSSSGSCQMAARVW